MGLNCTHGAFDGAYSSFIRLRQYVARCAGGSYPPHENPRSDWNSEWWYYDNNVVPAEHIDGCVAFLGHSDCDEEFSPEECVKVAGFLEWVALNASCERSTGNLLRAGPKMRDAVLRFANGCRTAAAAGESLEFL